MTADMKAATDWARSWAASIPDSTEKVVAHAFLEVTAELERERKARIEIDARWQAQFERAERVESTIIKDRVFMAAERKARRALEEELKGWREGTYHGF